MRQFLVLSIGLFLVLSRIVILSHYGGCCCRSLSSPDFQSIISLCQNILRNDAMHIGQTEVAASVVVGQAFVI